MRHGHEFDETQYAEYDMKSVLKIDDLEGEFLLAIVRRLTKRDP
jgi:hypothetical protein